MDESNPEHIGHVPRGQARSQMEKENIFLDWKETFQPH